MKGLLFYLLFMTTIAAHAQLQPFNYGQNKSVYFVSAAQRELWCLNDIYFLRQQNQDYIDSVVSIEHINFDENQFEISWMMSEDFHPANFNIESLVDRGYLMYGNTIYYCENQLTEVVGFGHGTRHESSFYVVNPSLLVRIQEPTVMLQYHYNANGLLTMLTTIEVPKIKWAFDESYRRDSSSNIYAYWLDRLPIKIEHNSPESLLNNRMYYRYFKQAMTVRTVNIDSLFFHYTSKGILSYSNWNSSKHKIYYNSPKPDYNDIEEFKLQVYFTQSFIGNIPFEKFIKDKLGYLPKRLYIEIYSQAVIRYDYYPEMKMYIKTDVICLNGRLY